MTRLACLRSQGQYGKEESFHVAVTDPKAISLKRSLYQLALLKYSTAWPTFWNFL